MMIDASEGVVEIWKYHSRAIGLSNGGFIALRGSSLEARQYISGCTYTGY